jgi:hypothetical protein
VNGSVAGRRLFAHLLAFQGEDDGAARKSKLPRIGTGLILGHRKLRNVPDQVFPLQKVFVPAAPSVCFIIRERASEGESAIRKVEGAVKQSC